MKTRLMRREVTEGAKVPEQRRQKLWSRNAKRQRAESLRLRGRNPRETEKRGEGGGTRRGQKPVTRCRRNEQKGGISKKEKEVKLGLLCAIRFTCLVRDRGSYG